MSVFSASTSIAAPIVSHVRRPRLRVAVDGVVLNGAVSASISSSTYFRPDSWRFQAALGADPLRRMAYWSGTDRIEVEIALALLPQGAPEGVGPWLPLISGFVDHASVDPVNGWLEAVGRDYAGVLQDTRTQETFANLTASEVAGKIAGRHGFAAQATATKTLVGAYYQLSHSHLTDACGTDQTTEWDLLTRLARQEGYAVWIAGKVLHFEPADPPDARPVPIVYAPPGAPSTSPLLNAAGLRVERDFQRSHGVQVVVQTMQARSGKALAYRYPETAGTGDGGTGDGGMDNGGVGPQVFTFTRPNLTPDQGQQFARTAYRDIVRHERRVEIEMPGELSLTPRDLIALSGTGTDWDQSYWIDSIERQISFDGGFVQTVTARNHSPKYQESDR